MEGMIFIYIIIAFILGIIFIQWVIPLIDGIINVILTLFEVWKGKMAIKITQSQAQVEQVKNKYSVVEQTSPIGFMITTEDEEEEDLND